jgi:hypothetical protein
VLRTAQDIFALDNAFFLIEGHPSRPNVEAKGWDLFRRGACFHTFLPPKPDSLNPLVLADI